MKPMLSIIIPCYNGEIYLADAVNSVLKQPCQDLEVIIVDDGSRDSSGVIADRLAAEHGNIRVIHIPNSGVSVARNTGIDQAQGRYIGFLDADDVLCRDAYDDQLWEVLASGGYDILSFSYLTGTEDLLRGRRMPVGAPGLYCREDGNYIRQTDKHFCSYLYNKILFSDAVRFPAGIRYNEDFCFLFLASRAAGRLMQYEKPWFVYRMHTGSVMHRLKNADFALEAIDGLAWCLKNCTQTKDIRDCEGNIFACMVKYIRLGCMCGTPASRITENVISHPVFQAAMAHYGEFWCSEDDKALYETFLAEPRKVWIRYRAKGIIHHTAQHMSRTAPGKLVNRKLRYKLPLRPYFIT